MKVKLGKVTVLEFAKIRSFFFGKTDNVDDPTKAFYWIIDGINVSCDKANA